MTFRLIQELIPSMPILIPAAEYDERSGRMSCRGVAVFLALLCLLLLVGLTTMASLCKVLHFRNNCLVIHVLSGCPVIFMPWITLQEECVTDAMDDSRKQMALLVTTYNNATSERDQLLARNMELERRTEQLQQRIGNLSNHNNELQTRIQGNSTSHIFLEMRGSAKDGKKTNLRISPYLYVAYLNSTLSNSQLWTFILRFLPHRVVISHRWGSLT